MADQTNIKRLEEANVLHSGDMSDEHKRIINEEMTPEEIDALIKAKQRIQDHPSTQGRGKDPWRPDRDGGAF